MRKTTITVAALAVLVAAGSLLVFAAGGAERFFTTRAGARRLELPKEDASFTFAIIGDHTGGTPEGLKVLEQAVKDINLLGPDFTMTVGDLIEGYTGPVEWVERAAEFKAIAGKLDAPWFPCAGNHDIAWQAVGSARGQERPREEHEPLFEKHFGPVWYAFTHKNSWFIVLYTDEGDPETGQRHSARPEAQRMSPAQRRWLAGILKRAAGADHVFVFLHHPRWIAPVGEQINYGDDWETVHTMLVEAGNVSAVFGGHLHFATYAKRDGIEYFTVAVTGGTVRGGIDDPKAGFLQHVNLVTVRKDGVHVAIVPVGSVIDPRNLALPNPARHPRLQRFFGGDD